MSSSQCCVSKCFWTGKESVIFTPGLFITMFLSRILLAKNAPRFHRSLTEFLPASALVLCTFSMACSAASFHLSSGERYSFCNRARPFCCLQTFWILAAAFARSSFSASRFPSWYPSAILLRTEGFLSSS
ncbi:hypothetical protein C8J55DRAFT_509031 [Lentinula edodes]|uniref:Uncharacterized protein n=1 Tax=Lentinula lateritia TaxID=40482 RepID=A0A9W9AMV6_9AGAR|nr:hypothetical protein C8J55DRAFT_509031 [Lentinula edodes]